MLGLDRVEMIQCLNILKKNNALMRLLLEQIL